MIYLNFSLLIYFDKFLKICFAATLIHTCESLKTMPEDPKNLKINPPNSQK